MGILISLICCKTAY